MKILEFCSGQCVGPTPRTHSSPNQAFVGIYVSHAVKKFLVQQRRLNWRFAVMKEPGKFFSADVGGLGAGSLKTSAVIAAVTNFKSSKASRIDKTQLPA